MYVYTDINDQYIACQNSSGYCKVPTIRCDKHTPMKTLSVLILGPMLDLDNMEMLHIDN